VKRLKEGRIFVPYILAESSALDPEGAAEQFMGKEGNKRKQGPSDFSQIRDCGTPCITFIWHERKVARVA